MENWSTSIYRTHFADIQSFWQLSQSSWQLSQSFGVIGLVAPSTCVFAPSIPVPLEAFALLASRSASASALIAARLASSDDTDFAPARPAATCSCCMAMRRSFSSGSRKVRPLCTPQHNVNDAILNSKIILSDGSRRLLKTLLQFKLELPMGAGCNSHATSTYMVRNPWHRCPFPQLEILGACPPDEIAHRHLAAARFA